MLAGYRQCMLMLGDDALHDGDDDLIELGVGGCFVCVCVCVCVCVYANVYVCNCVCVFV